MGDREQDAWWRQERGRLRPGQTGEQSTRPEGRQNRRCTCRGEARIRAFGFRAESRAHEGCESVELSHIGEAASLHGFVPGHRRVALHAAAWES